MNINKEVISKNIIKHRQKKGFSQRQLAKLICVNPNSLSAVECARVVPSIGLLVKISVALEVSIDCLLDGNIIATENNNFVNTKNIAHLQFIENFKNVNVKHKIKIQEIMKKYIINVKKLDVPTEDKKIIL